MKQFNIRLNSDRVISIAGDDNLITEVCFVLQSAVNVVSFNIEGCMESPYSAFTKYSSNLFQAEVEQRIV